MTNDIKEIINKLEENKDDVYYVGYVDGVNIDNELMPKDIKTLLNHITNLQEENERLKFYLNDVVFDDNNIDVELSARYLRKLGYIDFDEERQVYVNKHNNQPFIQENIKEKTFYIKDDNLNDYTKQLENKIDKASEMIRFIAFNSERPLTLTELNKVYYILQGSEEE